MDRISHESHRRGRRGPLAALFALALALASTASALPTAGTDARYQAMPEPEAFAEPTSSFLTSSETSDSGSYTLSPSTLRFKAGRYYLFRFNADSGVLVRKRTVRFSTAVRYRVAHSLSTFGSYRYAKLTSGTWSGWYVRTNGVGGTSLTTLAADQQVRLAAGKHSGLRFYNKQRVTVRRVATLAQPASYTVGRQAIFNDRLFFYLTSGPLSGRWVAKSSAVSLVTQSSTANSTTTTSTVAPATWKALVLIYRETDVTFTRSDGSSYRLRARMSDTMYKLAREVTSKFGAAAKNWSDGYTALNMTVVDVPRTLTGLEQLSGGKYWISPRSVRPDMDKYAPTGTYDSIFVLYEAKDSAGVRIPTGGWGLSLPPGSWANGAGFSSIHTPAELWWWTNVKYPHEVYIHEWMHQVLFFHENGGRLKLDLHANAQYGYGAVDGSYRAWLSDVMRGRVQDGSRLLGVNYEMWRAASPTRPSGWSQ